METIGLIAGNGRFPVLFARTATAEGVGVVAVAHRGETDPALEGLVQNLIWIEVGQLGRMIEAFREAGVRRAVMAGGIRKATLMEHFAPDERGLQMLQRLSGWGDDVVLRAVAAELERDGIEIVESTLFLGSILTPPGVLCGEEPDEDAWADIRHGLRVARGVGRYDVGQTVVVKSRVVLAVEAIEGTDATVRRGGEMGRGDIVVVKVSKPGQDLRFDVPAIGPDTVPTCRESGVRVLALEARRTLLLEKAALLATARTAGLTIVGVSEESEE